MTYKVSSGTLRFYSLTVMIDFIQVPNADHLMQTGEWEWDVKSVLTNVWVLVWITLCTWVSSRWTPCGLRGLE